MTQSITSTKDTFEIHISVPKKMTGTYMYNEDETWEQSAVCVWIDKDRGEYGLYHTQYLDYKDSLQATHPIVFFESIEEAIVFAKKNNLAVEYAYNSSQNGFQN